MNDQIKTRYKGSWLEWLITLGTDNWYGRDKLGLIVANLTGYLASISSLGFAVTYATHDMKSLMPLVVGNIISASCTALTPLMHRFGRIAGALWLTGVFFVTLIWFTMLLGRESGIILNLVGTCAVAFAILGLERIKLVGAISVTGAIIIILCWILLPDPAAGIYNTPAFLNQIFASAIITIMAITFVVIYYAFYLTREAEGRLRGLMKAMMPDMIAERLMEKPDDTIAEAHEHVVVLFSDIVGFVEMSNRLGPQRVVALLDDMFRVFDKLAAEQGIEKIKTIGDAYMAVAGVPSKIGEPENAMMRFASHMMMCSEDIGNRHGVELNIRIGVASGPVTAGVVGQSKYSYDVWGPAVNMAARLEAAAEPGSIVTTGEVKVKLADEFVASRVGSADLKGFGKVPVWTVTVR